MNKLHVLTRAFKAVFPQLNSFDWTKSNDDHDLIFKDDLVALTNVETPPYKKIIKASNYINKLPALRSAINYADPTLTDMNAVSRDLVLVVHGIISNDERIVELVEKLEIAAAPQEEQTMKTVTDQTQTTKAPVAVVDAAMEDLISAEDRVSINNANALQQKVLGFGFSAMKSALAFNAKVTANERLTMEASSETIHELVTKRPVEAFKITSDQPLGVNLNVLDAIERFSTLLEEAVTEPSDAFYHRIASFVNNELPIFMTVKDGVITPNDEMIASVDVLLSIENKDVYYVTTLFKLLLVNLDNAKNVGEVITDAFYTAQLAEQMR